MRFNFLSSFSVTVVPPFPCFRDVPGKRTPAETILFYAFVYTMINLFKHVLFKQVISLVFQERKRCAHIFTLVHRKFTISPYFASAGFKEEMGAQKARPAAKKAPGVTESFFGKEP